MHGSRNNIWSIVFLCSKSLLGQVTVIRRPTPSCMKSPWILVKSNKLALNNEGVRDTDTTQSEIYSSVSTVSCHSLWHWFFFGFHSSVYVPNLLLNLCLLANHFLVFIEYKVLGTLNIKSNDDAIRAFKPVVHVPFKKQNNNKKKPNKKKRIPTLLEYSINWILYLQLCSLVNSKHLKVYHTKFIPLLRSFPLPLVMIQLPWRVDLLC